MTIEEENKVLRRAVAQVPYPEMGAGSADAIAYKLEQGVDNGGLTVDALAAWMRELATQLRSFSMHLNGLKSDTNKMKPFTRPLGHAEGEGQ